MKNIFLFTIVVSLITFPSFAQKELAFPVVKKMVLTQKDLDTIFALKPLIRPIKFYYVEENIKMKFGGYTTTYEVSHLSLIDIYDLGPNNTRIITPRYGEVNPLAYNSLEISKKLVAKKLNEPIKTDITISAYKEKLPIQNELTTFPELLRENDKELNSKKNEKFIYVHLIETYQRIADKGTKSIEIFQILGDAYFFEGEYKKAVKWYGELFSMTNTIGSEYYDRYVYSLRVLGQKDLANEIIKRLSNRESQ